jgi:hypothetical protein
MYPPSFAHALGEQGHDAIAVKSRADLVGRTDAALLAIATEEQRVLVSENARDFAALAAMLAERGQVHAGIVLVNPRRFPRTADGVARFVAACERLAVSRPGGLTSTVVWL